MDARTEQVPHADGVQAGANNNEVTMPLMVCCCHLIQRDEEFRCWALRLLQVGALRLGRVVDERAWDAC